MKEAMSLAAGLVIVVTMVVCAIASAVHALLLLSALAPFYTTAVFFALAIFLMFAAVTLLLWIGDV